MASQTSMPRSWANIASSLTSAMLTWRNVFSSSLVSSASVGVRHRHGAARRAVVERAAPRRRLAASMPRHDLRRVHEASSWRCPGRCARGCSRGGSPARPRRPEPASRIGRDELLGGAGVGGATRGSTVAPGGAVARPAGRRPPRCTTGRAAVAQRRGHRDHGDVEALEASGVGGRRGSGRWRARRPQLGVGDVLDEGRRPPPSALDLGARRRRSRRRRSRPRRPASPAAGRRSPARR